MKVHAIFEGRTEEKVLERLKSLYGLSFEHTHSNGKREIPRRIKGKLGPLIGDEPLRVLILRDLDMHEGETIERVVQSTEDALRQLVTNRHPSLNPKLEKLDGFENIYIWSSGNYPDIRIALHIATHRWSESFIKATIDDYILTIALQSHIANDLTKDIKVKGECIIEKVTKEIPKILNDNGIIMEEAKDYVRIYAAIIKSHTSPPVFAQKVLNQNGVDEKILKEHLRSLCAALEFLQ
jgi:predicted RNase H-like HicB family nuclease